MHPAALPGVRARASTQPQETPPVTSLASGYMRPGVITAGCRATWACSSHLTIGIAIMVAIIAQSSSQQHHIVIVASLHRCIVIVVVMMMMMMITTSAGNKWQ